MFLSRRKIIRISYKKSFKQPLQGFSWKVEERFPPFGCFPDGYSADRHYLSIGQVERYNHCTIVQLGSKTRIHEVRSNCWRIKNHIFIKVWPSILASREHRLFVRYLHERATKMSILVRRSCNRTYMNTPKQVENVYLDICKGPFQRNETGRTKRKRKTSKRTKITKS